MEAIQLIYYFFSIFPYFRNILVILALFDFPMWVRKFMNIILIFLSSLQHNIILILLSYEKRFYINAIYYLSKVKDD